MAFVDTFLDFVAGLFRKLATLCLGVMLAINIVNVAWRGIFDEAFGWVFSWTLLLFIWMLLIGFFAYVRDRRDVVVDIFAIRLSPGPKRALAVATDLVGIAVTLAILRGAPGLIALQTAPMEAINLPIWVRSLPLFVSSTLVLVHFANHALALVIGRAVPFERSAFHDQVETGAPE